MVFLVLVLRSWKALKLFVVVVFLLNFRKAVLRRLRAVLQSSLNQRMLCLFEVDILAIVYYWDEGFGEVFCLIYDIGVF